MTIDVPAEQARVKARWTHICVFYFKRKVENVPTYNTFYISWNAKLMRGLHNLVRYKRLGVLLQLNNNIVYTFKTSEVSRIQIQTKAVFCFKPELVPILRQNKAYKCLFRSQYDDGSYVCIPTFLNQSALSSVARASCVRLSIRGHP